MKTPKNAQEVIAYAKENEVRMVDFKFVDLMGKWQHFASPISQLEEEVFEDGLGFDGSSVRGWKAIHNSDMCVIPDPKTARMDPFTERPTLSLLCDIHDPITKEAYARDPRNICKKAAAFVKETGLADTVYFGPEPEFFIFDDVRYQAGANHASYSVDSVEAAWNTGREEYPNQGYKLGHKAGYFPVQPNDSQVNIRHEMVEVMESVGIEVEREHHEVATAGQAEIDFRFAPLVECADMTMWMKHIVKNVAFENGQTATFMPKPLAGDNGSGMHCHMSLWKNGEPLFAGDGYGGMSEMAMFYIGGVLKHARALTAFTNPSINSYRRLVPGFEAPTNLAYSASNRSAAVRIPMVSSSPKAKRIECRFPDPSANPYLAFAALTMAGLDGIENKIHPGDPLDKDIYGLSAEALKDVPQLPASLEESLQAIEADHQFLLKGDVFTEDLIKTWVAYKRDNDLVRFAQRPTPLEFELYYDI